MQGPCCPCVHYVLVLEQHLVHGHCPINICQINDRSHIVSNLTVAWNGSDLSEQHYKHKGWLLARLYSVWQADARQLTICTYRVLKALGVVSLTIGPFSELRKTLNKSGGGYVSIWENVRKVLASVLSEVCVWWVGEQKLKGAMWHCQFMEQRNPEGEVLLFQSVFSSHGLVLVKESKQSWQA